MLVLSRHTDEEVVFLLPDGREIVLKVVSIQGDKARLGFTADRDVKILRREVLERQTA